jgi:tRNA-modifying protein YgfZ
MAIEKLTQYSLLSFSGADCKTFLQGQLTCDLNQLDSMSTLGAHCNPKGRMISFFRLFERDNTYHLLMPSEILNTAKKALLKYAVFSKVDIDTKDITCYGITSNESNDLDYPDAINQVINHSDYSIISVPGVSRYLLIDFSNSMSFRCKSTTLWHNLDLAEGIPQLYENTVELFLPHYLNLPKLGAISFNKGCYTGQEIIARMQHRGQLKQQLYRLDSETPYSPGEKIEINGEKIGQCVDSAALENGHAINLVIVKDAIANKLSNIIKALK